NEETPQEPPPQQASSRHRKSLMSTHIEKVHSFIKDFYHTRRTLSRHRKQGSKLKLKTSSAKQARKLMKNLLNKWPNAMDSWQTLMNEQQMRKAVHRHLTTTNRTLVKTTPKLSDHDYLHQSNVNVVAAMTHLVD